MNPRRKKPITLADHMAGAPIAQVARFTPDSDKRNQLIIKKQYGQRQRLMRQTRWGSKSWS
jgi:hypothetical protein